MIGKAWPTIGAADPTKQAHTWEGQQTFDEPILIADGSASAPSLALATNPGTGLRKSGTNVLGVVINQVETYAFTSGALRVITALDGARDLGASAQRWQNGYFSGTLRFGTHSTIGGETVTGYISITDASGTPRKLAVVST